MEDSPNPTNANLDSIKFILYLNFETFPVLATDIPQPEEDSLTEEKSWS